jgi:hypothetical protein
MLAGWRSPSPMMEYPMTHIMNVVEYRLHPEIAHAQLDSLYAAAWPNHIAPRGFGCELESSLVYVGAYADLRLIGS